MALRGAGHTGKRPPPSAVEGIEEDSQCNAHICAVESFSVGRVAHVEIEISIVKTYG